MYWFIIILVCTDIEMNCVHSTYWGKMYAYCYFWSPIIFTFNYALMFFDILLFFLNENLYNLCHCVIFFFLPVWPYAHCLSPFAYISWERMKSAMKPFSQSLAHTHCSIQWLLSPEWDKNRKISWCTRFKKKWCANNTTMIERDDERLIRISSWLVFRYNCYPSTSSQRFSALRVTTTDRQRKLRETRVIFYLWAQKHSQQHFNWTKCWKISRSSNICNSMESVAIAFPMRGSRSTLEKN